MPKKILLIDNNEFTNLYFRDIFWMHPGSDGEYYEVVTTKDLTGAKDFLKKERPVAIFIEPSSTDDNRKRDLTNHLRAAEFISDLKSSDLKDVRVAAYSDHESDVLIEEMKKAGADTFVNKGKQTAESLVDIVDDLVHQKV